MDRRKATVGAGVAAAGIAGLAVAFVLSGTGVVFQNTTTETQTKLIGAAVAPCTKTLSPGGQSFDAANKAASPGDIICLADGSYSTQTVLVDASKTSNNDVTFRGSRNAVVAGLTVGQTGQTNGASHLIFDGFKLNTPPTTRQGASDISFVNLKAPAFKLSGGGGTSAQGICSESQLKNDQIGNDTCPQAVAIFGGDYGPYNNDVNQMNSRVHNVVLRGAQVHDVTVSDPLLHAECIHVWGVRGLVITQNRLWDCTDFGIFMKREGGKPLGDPFEDGWVYNNMVDEPMPGNGNQPGGSTFACNQTNNCYRGGSSLRVASDGGPVSNLHLDYNSVLGGIAIDAGQPTVTQKQNITKANAAANYVNATPGASMDLHLKAGAPAINAGDINDYPPLDYDGNKRFVGSAPDTGADEFGASGGGGGTTTTESTTTTTTSSTTSTTTTSSTTTTTTPPTDSLPLTIDCSAATTCLVSWTPQGDQGYRYLVDGKSVSNTNNSATASAKFSKKPGAVIKVIARNEKASGSVAIP